jgi:hypothetical protein
MPYMHLYSTVLINKDSEWIRIKLEFSRLLLPIKTALYKDIGLPLITNNNEDNIVGILI